MIGHVPYASFQVGRAFERGNNINSMDFSDDGQLLVAAAEDDSLVAYHAAQGRFVSTISLSSYGC